MRYLRLSSLKVPYSQIPCISGLRVFGTGTGPKPPVASFSVSRITDLDMEVSIEEQNDTVGFNVLFGESEDKLYNSVMLFGHKKKIGALIKGRKYFVRVDSFNEYGITEGEVHGIF